MLSSFLFSCGACVSKTSSTSAARPRQTRATMLDALVVGGGPAGLATAHAIITARPGARVAVLERSDVRPRGATVGLAPNGVRALEALRPELKEAVARHHAEHEETKRFDPQGQPFATGANGGISRIRDHGQLLYVPWHAIQRELAAALPPGVLHTRHRFLRYTEREAPGGGGSSVLAEFETPEGGVRQLEAALLVGCDGGQSAVRQQLLGDGPPSFLGMAVWRAVRPVPPGWEHSHATWGRFGQAVVTSTLGDGTMAWQAFAPWPTDELHVIGGGRRAYIQDSDPAELAAAGASSNGQSQEEVGKARLQRALAAFEGYPQFVLDLMAGTDPTAVTEHGQFCREAQQCQTYARGRVALVGDAAHLATPFLGQGTSQAFEDALELGRAVGQRGPTPEALAAYQAVRLPLSGAVQAASVELCREFASGNMSRSEYDVNIERGFVKRTFEPLIAATPAAAAVAASG